LATAVPGSRLRMPLLLRLLWLLAAGLVARSLLSSHGGSELPRSRQRARARYVAACHRYGVEPSADILTWLWLGSSGLKIQRRATGRPFGDLDLYPLAELLADGGAFFGRAPLRSLDLSHARLGPSGAALAARFLRLASCRLVESFDISEQPLYHEGAAAVLEAVRGAEYLQCLRMKGCRLGDDGAMHLVGLLREDRAARLREVDLQNNNIGFGMCEVIEASARARSHAVQVLLAGNRILDEVLNAATHGVGCILSIVGSLFLGLGVRGKPATYKISVVVYSVALNVLYLSSTLFHSFFGLGSTVVWVFGVMDHCAIYLLIAGTYCPFLWILFPRDPYADRLLAVMWAAAFAGMGTNAFYYGQGKSVIGLTLYLGMGWSCTLRLREMVRRLGPSGTRLLVLGGLLYTGGVPLFIKNRRTCGIPDHTLWHLFVLAGSTSHYFCILRHCVLRDSGCSEGTRAIKA